MTDSKEHSEGVWIIKKIDTYIRGQLSREEEEKLWVELLKNPEYLEYLETELGARAASGERATRSAADPAPGQADTAGYSPFISRAWRWIAAAASVMLVFLALYLYPGTGRQDLSNRAVTEIALADNLATVETLRSGVGEGRGEAESLLARGHETALSGETGRAIQLYRSAVEQFQDPAISSRAYLNMGILYYNRGDFKEAADSFSRVLSGGVGDSWLNERAYWFLGNSYLQLGRVNKAEEVLREVRSLDGIYARRAETLLKQLRER